MRRNHGKFDGDNNNNKIKNNNIGCNTQAQLLAEVLHSSLMVILKYRILTISQT